MRRKRNRSYANCMFLINMIRSGLVNQRKGGGFEEGYFHQRDNTPRDEVMRPYVDGFDTGMGKPTDFSFVVPKPVSYSNIFSKTITPDERIYLLKMVQMGVKRIGDQLEKGLKKPGDNVAISFEFPFMDCSSKVEHVELVKIFNSQAKPKLLRCQPMNKDNNDNK